MVDAIMTDNWALSFLALIPLIGVACFARVQQGSWYAPGAFFCLLWSAYTLAPLVIAPSFHVWPGGVIAISIAGFAVYVGSLTGYGGIGSVLGKSSSSAIRNTFHQGAAHRGDFPGLVWLTILCSALGCVAVLVAVTHAGFSLAELVSIESFMSIGHAFSVARYSEDYRPPMLVQVLTLIMYTGALLGGTLFCRAKNKFDLIVAFLPFLPAVFFTFVFTTRASLLLQGVMWFSSHMANVVSSHGWNAPLFTKRFNVAIFILAPLGFLIMIGALVIRTGEDLDLSWLLSMIIIDIVGHLSAFSSWLELSWQSDTTPTLGAFTFAGIFEILGLSGRIGGLYEELVEVGPEFGADVANNTTNIYTAFRGIIQDASVPLAPIVLFFLGCLAGVVYKGVAKGSTLGMPILAAFYSFCIWSLFVSFTVYNTLLGAYCLFFSYAVAAQVHYKIFFKASSAR